MKRNFLENLETKKPSITQTVLNIFDFNTCLYQSIPSNRDDDDNDVMLKNWVSLLKFCGTNVELIFKLQRFF
ncbi:hypothetical protein A0O34_19560 [Chryseobacterium glaciei]|uniref:Uncharacterized protein n=1 Tax=Chryseobacterium glaciei TaxID=1685010 RepID=A0A172Y0I6_9FLAO|nr:hypothetical protein A0O34_19560 [Chryseobacterium glaciei]